MMRRKINNETGADGANANVHATIPMGGDNQFSTPKTRRRRKKTQSSFRSCLIRLRILNDGRKKLDINARKGSGHRGSDPAFCFCFSGLICFLMISLGLYLAVTWLDGSNANLILRTTTSFPSDLVGSLEDLRPLVVDEMPIVFSHGSMKHKKNHPISNGKFYYPSKMHHKEAREGEYVDFGNIDLKLLSSEDQKRQIYVMVADLQGDPRSLDRERDDDMEMYWAFDDDIERNPYNLYDDYVPEMAGRCHRVPWHRYLLTNCNAMHELDLVIKTPRFVGDGAYREVFVTEQPYLDGVEQLIFKELRWDLDMGVDDYEYVRMDAFVTERFTSHPQITDIYGYCGLSMITEFFPYGDIEDDVVGFPHHRKNFNPFKDEVLKPLNNFTGSEKLQLALNMVEPVAALHNYPGGVIVHDDIQLCQYLWTGKDGLDVKLNDFNRAEIMLWDEQSQKYCKYKNGRGHGDWRAPEEYKDRPLDEKIDIWSLGNNMYSVLTGVYPFFNVEEDKQIQKLIKDGETAAIDPRYVDRSFAESKLIEVIERCFVYDPDERADINEIWRMLKDAIAENEKYEEEEARKKAQAAEQQAIDSQHLQEAEQKAQQNVNEKEEKLNALAAEDPKTPKTQKQGAGTPQEVGKAEQKAVEFEEERRKENARKRAELEKQNLTGGAQKGSIANNERREP